ncbi:MAG: extracellular solute-binding protein [Armatimonadetes bacterium]|nr:extracellular solute-binding protein [Armatimonadota bacterium]
MRYFPYGKAPLVILTATLAAALYLATHPVAKTQATLRYWTFAKTHYDAYKAVIPAFEKKHPGVKVDLQLVSGTAVTSRLQAAFWADLDVPDLVEVEISSAGSFFRGPIQDVGFIDLTGRLKKSGYYDRIVKSRFAPYTNRGRIFGLPHDVHPVMLAYRRDIFEAERIDPAKLTTWDKFIRAGRRLTIPGKRYMMELSDTDASNLEMLLFQRGGGYFDPDGKLIMDNAVAVETMRWYVPLVAGDEKIGNTLGGGNQILTQAVEQGYLLTLICPDWRSKFFEDDIPRMSGKMALMPLPAVRPGGPRTSTWGGTMVGITRHCPSPDLAWELAQHCYLDREQMGERFQETNILAPLRDAWDLPAFREPRAYWSNQPIGEIYARLADQTPAQYTSPFIQLAKSKMGEALVACVQYYQAHGEDGFAECAARAIKASADEVRRAMRRNPY